MLMANDSACANTRVGFFNKPTSTFMIRLYLLGKRLVVVRKRAHLPKIILALCLCFFSTKATQAAFENVTTAAGLSAIELGDRGRFIDQVVQGGAPTIIDFNSDGWSDIYITRFMLEDLLFLNDGDGTFTRVEQPLGISTKNGGNAPLWIDIDNDGDKDLIVATVEEYSHRLYLNEGNGTFREAAEEHGIDLTSTALHSGTAVAAGDINRDGYLDIFIGEWGTTLDPYQIPQHYALLLNQGPEQPGHFINIAQESGVRFDVSNQDIYSPAFTDLDNDGWPDLAIVADFQDSELFWNNTNLTFLRSTTASNVGHDDDGMGTAIADFNGDGRLDWFVSTISFLVDTSASNGNALYINKGSRLFENTAEEAGVINGGWAWGANAFDYDNNGSIDIVMTNENDTISRPDGSQATEPTAMVLWRNDGKGNFTNVAVSQSVDHIAKGAGIVNFDYDKDGDLDIFVYHQYSDPILFRNDNSPKNWIRLSLEGEVSNKDAFGTRVEIRNTPSDPTLIFEYNPSNTYLAQLEPYVHFGLGNHSDPISKITIRWPSGIVQRLTNVEPNQLLVIKENSSLLSNITLPTFTEQPTNQVINPGETITLEFTVNGGRNVSINWYHNGNLVTGESETTLVIEDAKLADAGKYYATATNAAGTSYSSHARVSIQSLYTDKSVARQWMEELLNAIRIDYPAPTVHSRNLLSTSVAMWDAWAAYNPGTPYIADEGPIVIAQDLETKKAHQNEAISFAAYRVLKTRFRLSPNYEITLPTLRDRMELLGYDANNTDITGNSPAAVGNRIAAKILAYGWSDGGNEKNNYVDPSGYQPINAPLIFKIPGAEPEFPNDWQPLAFDHLITQNGIVLGKTIQTFLGANWGAVEPFALVRPTANDVYSDPGPPPYLGSDTDQVFKDAALEVIEYSSWLDPSDGVMIDVSPKTRHNHTLGTNDGTGHALNPYTSLPYEENIVLRADYGRILAEFWADGPESETPPGHWNSVANYVSDHALFEKRFEGTGDILDPLEWDIKLYFAMNGAVSDAAIAAWDAKRKYNYTRPITMIRYMGGKGQSTDPDGLSYHIEGLPLKDNLVEIISIESAAEGERHQHLASHLGEVVIRSWAGLPDNPNTEYGGVGWILATTWMPYQRDTFVTPPFAAYTSGHSAFSRAGAEILTAMTGDPFFPGGISSFSANAHEFLEFETGPENDMTLTWATYYDAADEAGISRLYGGIHVWPDDLRGRIMGSNIGKNAFDKAKTYFDGTATTIDWNTTFDNWVDIEIADPELVSDPVYYTGNPYQRLAEAFYGASPFGNSDKPQNLTLIQNSEGVTTGLQFEVNSTLAISEHILEVSSDLKNWAPIAVEATDLTLTQIGNGKTQVRLELSQAEVLDESRFLRVAIRDAY